MLPTGGRGSAGARGLGQGGCRGADLHAGQCFVCLLHPWQSVSFLVNFSKALEHYKEQLANAKEVGDRKGEGGVR